MRYEVRELNRFRMVLIGTAKSTYKPAYKKLAKNAYSDSQQPSSIGK